MSPLPIGTRVTVRHINSGNPHSGIIASISMRNLPSGEYIVELGHAKIRVPVNAEELTPDIQLAFPYKFQLKDPL
ncbi:MAG: hypothetical protein E6R03_12720 [Hyphomicrobiaceae bacterium]|nr:MAG: hypothetical protein E6R03_12720 [Hyphomicrobiaceae bacterium]